jgi:hypothetical protein
MQPLPLASEGLEGRGPEVATMMLAGPTGAIVRLAATAAAGASAAATRGDMLMLMGRARWVRGNNKRDSDEGHDHVIRSGASQTGRN